MSTVILILMLIAIATKVAFKTPALLVAAIATSITIGYRLLASRAEAALATPRDSLWEKIPADQRALARATRYALAQTDFYSLHPKAADHGVSISRQLGIA